MANLEHLAILKQGVEQSLSQFFRLAISGPAARD